VRPPGRCRGSQMLNGSPRFGLRHSQRRADRSRQSVAMEATRTTAPHNATERRGFVTHLSCHKAPREPCCSAKREMADFFETRSRNCVSTWLNCWASTSHISPGPNDLRPSPPAPARSHPPCPLNPSLSRHCPGVTRRAVLHPHPCPATLPEARRYFRPHSSI
jgi:hypothetical protein